ncbi:MAG TPA: YciI family protein [Chitinophagaceae bacterium]|jgi:uncharacterized protein YciI|nr:YciI family protein [Chitinophagaceae bacterium]
MYFIELTYKAAMQEIDKWLSLHKEYLTPFMQSGRIMLSGRKVPRTGGFILADFTSAAEVDEFILNDPFFKQQLADYKTMQLEPTGFGPQFNKPS